MENVNHYWHSVIHNINGFTFFFINYLVQKYGKRFAKLMRTKNGIIPRPVLIVSDDDYQHTPRL